MYIRSWLKKAQLPGWAIIVSLIIGLFVLGFLIYIAFASKGVFAEKLDFIKRIF